MSMMKKIYVCILLLGMLLTVTGGTLLTIRAVERSQYTKTTVVEDIRIEGTADELNTLSSNIQTSVGDITKGESGNGK